MYSLALIAHEVSVTMRLLLVAAALVSASLASEAEDALQFARFRGQFGKQYHTRYSAVQYSTVQYSTVQYQARPEYERRFAIFRDNLRRYEEHNQSGASWTMGRR